MIYIKIKNQFGVSYGKYANAFQLKKRIKRDYVCYNGNKLKEHLQFLNAEKITREEYYEFLEK